MSALYELNTRVHLTALAAYLGRPATLDDIADADLDRWVELGFDWIWLLSVWQTGVAGRRVSRSNPDWRRAFEESLPDLREADIAGSGFAITAYTVPCEIGGEMALARLRDRMRQRGLRLMLDFVPNHTALDHSWVEEHRDYYISGTALDHERAPQNFTGIDGELFLAHGRDPYFLGWPDTLQLNYGNPATQQAMMDELEAVARRCDGVRCDMAMLLLPDVFERTWSLPAESFWPKAIAHIRSRIPNFCFMAEVYWDLEWTLLQQGFDYAYDKRLYDRLRTGRADPVRDHLRAGLDYQSRLSRFLENHDEPRAAATFSPDMHQAAAIVTYLSPGLGFFHEGQLDGRRKRISPHLVRAAPEPADEAIERFYEGLLEILRRPTLRNGQWQLIECKPAWDGNWTESCFIAWYWQGRGGQRLLIAVNYAANQSQCYVRLPWLDLRGRSVRLEDLLSPVIYDRNGSGLVEPGLYLDLPPWGRHVFELSMH